MRLPRVAADFSLARTISGRRRWTVARASDVAELSSATISHAIIVAELGYSQVQSLTDPFLNRLIGSEK